MGTIAQTAVYAFISTDSLFVSYVVMIITVHLWGKYVVFDRFLIDNVLQRIIYSPSIFL